VPQTKQALFIWYKDKDKTLRHKQTQILEIDTNKDNIKLDMYLEVLTSQQ
jgi:hypothetical protein